MIATKEELEAVYSRLLANCDKAIDQSTSEWAHNFWTQTKQKLLLLHQDPQHTFHCMPQGPKYSL